MTAIDNQARSVFLAALDRTPDAWPALLDEACGDNAELRSRVGQLLHAHQAIGSIHGGAEAPVVTVDQPAAEGPGTVIGPYKLLEQIGEGGFGTVFLAEQTQPVRRRVALKVIKAGMDSRQVVARFEAERQALAVLDHPHIAKVFDGGTTPASRPYFVMELVKGTPITRYCDDHRLTPVDRLGLFVQVCQAVQHAHQKGIIHRDLKPSNVLVAPYDGKPVVKVIDFGIAKAAGQPLTDRTLVTGFGAVIGTPEYMSPEQAELNNRDIDTRSDVYSLGVLLYELLTGSTPLTRRRVQEAALLEVLRVVREEEPPKPSTRLSESKESLPSISAQRHTEPGKLTKLFRGEVDWIVMKALEKDRGRRYDTANGFADDVQRYLAGEAVHAVPPSARYRFRKFARRNKAAFAIASAVALVVLVAVVALAVSSVLVWREKEQTRLEKDRAEANFRVALDAVDRFFTQVSESRHLKAHGLEGLRRDLLLTAKEFYEQFVRERSADRQLQAELGRAHMRLGFITDVLGSQGEAIALYEKALQMLRALAGEHPEEPAHQRDLADSHNKLGQLFEAVGQAEKAEKAYLECLAIVQLLVEKYPAIALYRRSLAAVTNNLATLYKESGRVKQAEAAYAEAHRLIDQLAKEQPEDSEILTRLSYSHYNWGVLYRETDRLKPAEAAFLEARGVQEVLATRHPDVPEYRSDLAATNHELGIVYWIGKRFTEAEEAYRRSRGIRESLSLQHPQVAQYQSDLAAIEGDLGNLHLSTGRTKDAEDAFTKIIVILEQLARKHPDVVQYQNHLAACHSNLGMVYRNTDRPGAAENSYKKARAILEELVKKRPDLLDFATKLGNMDTLLGNLRLTTGKHQDSLAWYAKAIPRLQGVLKQESRHQAAREYLRDAYWGRSEALSELGRHREALPDRDRAVELDDQREPTFRLGRIGTLLRLREPDRATAEAEELAKEGSAATVYDLACVYALASKDSSGAIEQVNQYAARAVELLRRAVHKGYQDSAHMKKDAALDRLRSREDFKKLLAETEKK